MRGDYLRPGGLHALLLAAVLCVTGCCDARQRREAAARRTWLELSRMLEEPVPGPKDWWDRYDARRGALLSLGADAIRPVGSRLLSADASAEERFEAAGLLGEIGDRRALPYLRQALTLKAPGLQRKISRVILRIGADEEAVPFLCLVLRRDIEEIYKAFAGNYHLGPPAVLWAAPIVYAIAYCAEPGHRALAELIKDPDPRVRCLGIHILIESRTEYYPIKVNKHWSLVPTLIDMVGDADLPRLKAYNGDEEDTRGMVSWLLNALTFNPDITVDEGFGAAQAEWREWYRGAAALSPAERLRRAWRASETWTEEQRARIGVSDQWELFTLAVALGDYPDKWVVGEIIDRLATSGLRVSMYARQQTDKIFERLRRWTGQEIEVPKEDWTELAPAARRLKTWWDRNKDYLVWDARAQRLIDKRN